MKIFTPLIGLCCFTVHTLLLSACESPDPEKTEVLAVKAQTAIQIDGEANEQVWQEAGWYPIDQRWLGDPYTAEDFQGRYKAAWDANYLYLLVEIVDDTLIDINADGLDRYWDDDCVEVFIDEDDSGGEHTNSFNAFAYHVALDYAAVDFGKEGPIYLNDHVNTRRTQDGTTYLWELAFAIYDSSYDETSDRNIPVILTAGKRMGFAVAYCDNDRSATRENFIGSVYVAGEDKNRGYIDADIFGDIVLQP